MHENAMQNGVRSCLFLMIVPMKFTKWFKKHFKLNIFLFWHWQLFGDYFQAFYLTIYALADAFIQSDLQCIQAIHVFISVLVL